MKLALKIVLGLLGAVVLALGAVTVAARFHDGPIAIFAGGPFTSGERVTGPEPDWSFVRDIPEVEFQLLDPPRSRTTWILEYDGRIFIPCGYMTTTWGRAWKRWPVEAEQDGRAILRIDGKLYDRQLVRVQDGPLTGPLTTELVRKYPVAQALDADAVASGYLWLFEMAPRR